MITLNAVLRGKYPDLVEVDRKHYEAGYDTRAQFSHEAFDLVTLADPEKMCLKPLREGRFCLQDKEHKGACSSHTFYCESCNKYRRGNPYRHHPEIGNFCFMCVAVTPYAKRHENPDGTTAYHSLGH